MIFGLVMSKKKDKVLVNCAFRQCAVPHCHTFQAKTSVKPFAIYIKYYVYVIYMALKEIIQD